jgi:hypothetical protein
MYRVNTVVDIFSLRNGKIHVYSWAGLSHHFKPKMPGFNKLLVQPVGCRPIRRNSSGLDFLYTFFRWFRPCRACHHQKSASRNIRQDKNYPQLNSTPSYCNIIKSHNNSFSNTRSWLFTSSRLRLHNRAVGKQNDSLQVDTRCQLATNQFARRSFACSPNDKGGD